MCVRPAIAETEILRTWQAARTNPDIVQTRLLHGIKPRVRGTLNAARKPSQNMRVAMPGISANGSVSRHFSAQSMAIATERASERLRVRKSVNQVGRSSA
jgi:hypothetical protein